ncbi:MAG: DUF1614 domain-containing protein [Candidatus Wildermuthbacteria bacterium]|nr:DUF1614 domain-containing protein [Candidatus Wildermuthbacteria bacterium]
MSWFPLNILEAGLRNLGLSSESAALVLVFAIAGSLFNIPLGKRGTSIVKQSQFFGLVKRQVALAQGVSINAGGALVPLAVSLYLLSRVPFKETLIAILLMILVCRIFSRYVPGRGVALSAFMPVAFSLAFGFFLARESLAQVSFISGTLGVLIGADLLRIPFLKKEGVGMLVVGGAGVFDGIFLVGMLSTLIAGL